MITTTIKHYNKATKGHNVYSATMVYKLFNAFTTLCETGVMSREKYDIYKDEMFSMKAYIDYEYTIDEMKQYL